LSEEEFLQIFPSHADKVQWWKRYVNEDGEQLLVRT
jgi:hypothetical protein